MASIFSNPYDKTELFSMQGAIINYAVAKLDSKRMIAAGKITKPLPVMTTGVQIQYIRRSVPQFGINSGGKATTLTRMLAYGPAQGQFSMDLLYGPKFTVQNFFKSLGSECGALDLKIRPQKINCNVGVVDKNAPRKVMSTIVIRGATLNTFGFTYQVDQSGMCVVRMPLQFEFSGLQFIDGEAEE